jgi:hypothetical protein
VSEYDNTNTGALFNNAADKREGKKDPDYKGTVNAAGVDYWVSGWINTSKAGAKYLSLKLTPKEEKPATAIRPPEFDDEIPF